MALTYGKLNILLNRSKTINLVAVLLQRTSFQDVQSAAYCSNKSQTPKETLGRAMKSYLQKVEEYDKFLKEQLEEYSRGKEFLAGMMGRKSKEMTQKDVDEAIDYLFPSALFVPKARPMMKPPEEIYPKPTIAAFDYSGRPYHFLFYTSKMNYCQVLHDAASKLEELNLHISRKEIPPKPLLLVGGRWINQKELEEKFMEKLFTVEFQKFIEVFETLAKHPFSVLAEDLIKKFWVYEKVSFDMEVPTPTVTEEGIQIVNVEGKYEDRGLQGSLRESFFFSNRMKTVIYCPGV